MNMRIAQLRPAFAFLLAVTLAAIIFASAPAEEIDTKLTGAEETPPIATSAYGTARISINADKIVAGKIETSGIEGFAARIHLGSPGQAGPPIIALVKSDKGVWNVTPNSRLTDEQFASFKVGNLYVNVHSAEHPQGEIRGQLIR
jgi:CHRD domain